MQTILGAGGTIGRELAIELKKYTQHIRLVSRNPRKVHPEDELISADLLDPVQVDRAVVGSEIVYLTVGLKYSYEVWKIQWPRIMHNVIEACKAHKAKLVFFDNVYLYDPDHIHHMTEETPVRPISKKGKVRQELVHMLEKEITSGTLTALIARSADFMSTQNSVFSETVYKYLVTGKKANWPGRVDKLHNFTLATDAAYGTALLGNTPDAYGQVWHLPTDKKALTGKQWVELLARELGQKPALRGTPTWMFGVLGVFIPMLKELQEMNYQYELDYVFDSRKFEERFGYTPSTPLESIRWLISRFREEAESPHHP